MDNINYFKDLFESIPDYRKIVLLMFLFQDDENLLREIGFSERDIRSLNLEFKNIVSEPQENYLEYVKNEEESVIEKFLKR